MMSRLAPALTLLAMLSAACGDSELHYVDPSNDAVPPEEAPAQEQDRPDPLPLIETRDRWGGRDVQAELSAFNDCDIDSACATGHVCRGFCLPQSPTPGALGGACAGGCDAGLACRDEVCVDPVLLQAYYHHLVLTPEEFYAGELPMFATRGLGLEGMEDTMLASSSDLATTPYLPLPGNQGSFGSCLAFAAGYAASTYAFAERDMLDVRASSNSDHIRSPAYLYNQARAYMAWCDNEGSNSPSAILTLRTHGVPSERAFPYTSDAVTSCSTDLTREAKLDANAHRISSANYLFKDRDYTKPMDQELISDTELTAIKTQLAQGRPVVVAIRTPYEFGLLDSDAPLAAPLQPYAVVEGEINHGLHAIVVTGYDDKAGTLRIQNSWGTGWGDAGMANLTYEAARLILIEAWVMTAAPRPKDTLEVRLEWTEGVDLDLFLTEPGVGTYSYRGVPDGAGRFLNHESCRNDNAHCSPMVLSTERVTWDEALHPMGPVHIKVHNNAEVPASARLLISRAGVELEERPLEVEGGAEVEFDLELR